jgi:hypothetical protein
METSKTELAEVLTRQLLDVTFRGGETRNVLSVFVARFEGILDAIDEITLPGGHLNDGVNGACSAQS